MHPFLLIGASICKLPVGSLPRIVSVLKECPLGEDTHMEA